MTDGGRRDKRGKGYGLWVMGYGLWGKGGSRRAESGERGRVKGKKQTISLDINLDIFCYMHKLSLLN